ncbi:MAG: small multi-drug export protein [Lachnospiraceae bacterium]|nr:small multi-drug export protein [Lachnospiraceae bacterium]
MNSIAQWFVDHLGGFLSPEAIVFLISMLPLIEVRGGIPIAFAFGLPMWQAILISVCGNILPIPFILLFIRKIFAWLRPTKVLGPLVRKLENRAMNKSDSIEKMEFWGLLIFVGIPLPGTGGWTGALIAALLEIDIKKASLAILCGIALATIVMCLITYGVIGHIF